MIRTLCRVTVRQLPRVCFQESKGFVRVNSMYIARAYVSSSWVNHRRISYDVEDGKAKPLSLFDDDDDDGDIVTEVKKTKRKRTKKQLSEEVLSDESESDDDSYNNQRRSFKLDYINLKKHDAASRREIEMCLRETGPGGSKLLVKEFRNVEFFLQRGIRPKKIFFTILNDVAGMRAPLDGIELYKIHPMDLPPAMKYRGRSPFFAIFDIDDLQYKERTDNLNPPIPLTIICDNVGLPSHTGIIIAAAATSDCQQLLYTSPGKKFWHPRMLITAASSLSRTPIEFDVSWDTIRSKIKEDATVLVTRIRAHLGGESIPTVNLYDLDAWKTSEVALICTDRLNDEAIEFCEERNGREIVIPGAGVEFYENMMSIGAITVELRAQWEATKKQAKTKVK